MTLEYTVTEKDYLNFYTFQRKYAKLKGPRIIQTVCCAVCAIFVMLPFFSMAPSGSMDAVSFLLPCALGAAVFLLMQFLFAKTYPWMIKMHLREWNPTHPLVPRRLALVSGGNPDIIGPHTLTLHENTMDVFDRHVANTAAYSDIEKICRYADCLYLYTDAVKAAIVPVSAFESAQQQEKFIQTIENKTGLSILCS